MGVEKGSRPAVENYFAECLRLEEEFVHPPKAKLLLVSQSPMGEEIGARDIAISSALQCYAPGTAAMTMRPEKKYQEIADSTLYAGHHTTRMHLSYTFLIEGASRDVTHDVLHFHPFYNTSQQSQRYVEAKEGSYLEPAKLTEQQREIYLESAKEANRNYFELLVLLEPEVESRLRSIYPRGGWQNSRVAERLETRSQKLCQEIARYVLPIAQITNLYYTVNELQLLRMFRASQLPNYSKEARLITAKMVQKVAEFDEQIMADLEEPFPEIERDDFNEVYIRQQKKEFDFQLGERQSQLILSPYNAREKLALAVRNVLGVSERNLSDPEALLFLMDPKNNQLLADVYEVGMMDPLTSCLREVSFTNATKLSHTADSQRQRQRRTPGATPPIAAMYDGNADYVTPFIVRKSDELRTKYELMMASSYRNIERCLKAGIPKDWALLLLPNAHAIRVVESGDLFDWFHRFKQRLCFLAQEEIFFITAEQAEQMIERIPESEMMILAPCGLRKSSSLSPKCPEGERWCGQAVFNMGIEDYKERRLI